MSLPSSGSPRLQRRHVDCRNLHHESDAFQVPGVHGRKTSGYKNRKTSSGQLAPLVTCKLGNSKPAASPNNGSPLNKKLEHSTVHIGPSSSSEVDLIMTELSLKDSYAIDDLAGNHSRNWNSLDKGKGSVAPNQDVAGTRGDRDHFSIASPLTPTTECLAVTLSTEGSYCGSQTDISSEVLRLKQELLAAKSKIAVQEHELAQTRVIQHTLDQALESPSEVSIDERQDSELGINNTHPGFDASKHTAKQLDGAWNDQGHNSDTSDAFSVGTHKILRGLWLPSCTIQEEQAFESHSKICNVPKTYGDSLSLYGSSIHREPNSKSWTGSSSGTEHTCQDSFQSHRFFPGSFFSSPRRESQSTGNQSRSLQDQGTGSSIGLRRTNAQIHRGGSYFPGQYHTRETPSTNSIDSIVHSPANRQCDYQPAGIYQTVSYQPEPVGTSFSPTAPEFVSTNTCMNIWGNPTQVGGSSIQTYMPSLEPLNYRRLLDKNVSCDWSYIVDKIVCNNDQQASLFLQQKLKVGTVEQKFKMIEAIVKRAYPLMVNRFGNFLVQRCFEHGTPEQVVAIANAIKGNTLSLSMDPFGCHVVQKAFDCVPEEHKALMVHELLRRIPETVVHRYACHVWQKLLELRWSGEPPQIMAKVNDALRGLWHEVALGETGSLVVQNIFENCMDDEKRSAIEEVLAKIDVLAHGQFGNWCIQHICEHGAPHDKSRAVEHILLFAVDYSMDQFASKIVEKCLKIGGSEFLDRYLAQVCARQADRPRIPLIDIAGDQYGNYLIQWILMNAAPHQREIVATNIRKHMVSLRGSKFGSRVAMLCCNQAHVTRPGQSASVQVNRFNSFSDDRFHVPSNGRPGRANHWHSQYPPFR